MRTYLSLLSALLCLPFFVHAKLSEHGNLRHHIGIDFVFMPQYSRYPGYSKQILDYNREGGDISYRFCIMENMRVGMFYETTAQEYKNIWSGDGVIGLTLDFPIWIANRFAIAPGGSINMFWDKTRDKYPHNTMGLYVNFIGRITNTLALSVEPGYRKEGYYRSRQYPVRIGLKILL